MEKLNTDVKMKILMDLSSDEIIRVCQTNKDLSRACGDTRYNPLWYQKIKQDFDITYNGNNGYEEYKFLYRLHRTPIYTVSASFGEDIKTNISLTYEDALEFLNTETEWLEEEYPKIRRSILNIREGSQLHKNLYGTEISLILSKNFIQSKQQPVLYPVNKREIRELYVYNQAIKGDEFYKIFEKFRNRDEISHDLFYTLDKILYHMFMFMEDRYEDIKNKPLIISEIEKTSKPLVDKFINYYKLENYKNQIYDFVVQKSYENFMKG